MGFWICVLLLIKMRLLLNYWTSVKIKYSSAKRNPAAQKWASAEELLFFNFKENCVFCGEMCHLRPDPFFPLKWKKSILCQTVNSGKAKKLSRMSYCSLCFFVIDDGNLSWILSGIQNLTLTKNSCDLWIHFNLKFVSIFKDGCHNSHWNLYVKLVKMNRTFFSISSFWDSQNNFEDLVKINLTFSKISITFQRLFSQILYNLFSNSSFLGVIFLCLLIDIENIST